MVINCFFCQRRLECSIHSKETFFKNKNLSSLKELSSASPPSVFVGSRLKYPQVNIGVLSPIQDTKQNWIYDAQNYWAQNNYAINDIVELRSQLINSRTQTKVKEINQNRLISAFQEIAMSITPVQIELELKQKINFQVRFDQVSLPQGPVAPIQKLKITQNPHIPQKIEKVFSDTDLKASEALNYLYKTGFDEKILSQLLTVGVLGQKHSRRLVPTRFSITATDDTLSKNLIQEIKQYKQIEEYQVYFGSYLGNYYLIILIPDLFSYELFETYLPDSRYKAPEPMTDYESYFGRKTYATNTAGGYYATRLAILEKLKDVKRQASALVLRFITSEYSTPLGVFVVRAATRKSLKNKIQNFSSLEQSLNYATIFTKTIFKYDLDNIIKNSKLLKNKEQTNLKRFF